MSSHGAFGGRNRYPSLPTGEEVARFEGYPEAQHAVDVLALADFPVAGVSIVGNDLRTVERVTGKLNWGRAAAAGAASGGWLGVFFGLMLFIFAPSGGKGFGMLVAAVLIGAGFGALFGVVTHALGRRKKDFTSVMQVVAGSYSVIVDAENANRARRVLEEAGASGAQTSPERTGERHPSEPPRSYSQAIDEASRTGTGAAGPGAADEPDDAPEEDEEPPRYGERIPREQRRPPEDGDDAGR